MEPRPAPARLNGSTMTQFVFRNHHEREAARLRSLIANATTSRVKARLLEEAEKFDQLSAEGLEDLYVPAVP
jgi:hypothetical protein